MEVAEKITPEWRPERADTLRKMFQNEKGKDLRKAPGNYAEERVVELSRKTAWKIFIAE